MTCQLAPAEAPQCADCGVVELKEGEDQCTASMNACIELEKNPMEECEEFGPEEVEKFYGIMTSANCMASFRDAIIAEENHQDHHPVKFCGGGEYVKNKDTHDEKCELCPAGKFSKDKTFRNRRCKKCPEDTYMPFPGAKSCLKCPTDMNTKDQRGKKQCFDASGVSMKALNIDPKEYA